MTNDLYLKICESQYTYGEYLINPFGVHEIHEQPICDEKFKCIKLDSAFVHYLIKEIKLSIYYRKCFYNYWRSSLKLLLKSTCYNLIDYNWNERVFVMVRERCELDHALSWLSTLGGAFSALGDYYISYAETAGKISYHQLKLALMLGDPNIASRCCLYYSLSLIQKKDFRRAQRIISQEYVKAKDAVVKDEKILNMCKGIWAKLKYEYILFKDQKKTCK